MSIGICINTFNREDSFNKVYNSIPKHKIDELIIVKDGGYPYNSLDSIKDIVLDFPSTNGIATSKNAGLAYLMHKKCDHIFLIEDDIIVKEDDVFDRYISAAKESGIYHLMFSKVGDNPIRKTIHNIDLHEKCQGAFMYMLRGVVKSIGGFDQGFKNAYEHIEWTYRCSLKKLVPPFWWFPDMIDSDNYLEENECESTITNKPQYHENVDSSGRYFFKKYGMCVGDIPSTVLEDVSCSMDSIRLNYSR